MFVIVRASLDNIWIGYIICEVTGEDSTYICWKLVQSLKMIKKTAAYYMIVKDADV
jgi:hypothetical protein